MRSYSRQAKEIKVISMPCSGKLDILYLTKAFDTGADGAAIMICKEGECRYMEGNMRARKRAEAIDELLEETGLGRGRIRSNSDGRRGHNRGYPEIRRFPSSHKDNGSEYSGSANISD